jgi:hypothetical protein
LLALSRSLAHALAFALSGLSRFDIIRVGESPSTWGLRLLVNSAVIGRMESGQATLEVKWKMVMISSNFIVDLLL